VILHAEYGAILSDEPIGDGDARDPVTFELIPRQRKHITELSAILAQLSA
jgi:hypothetical protein